MMTCDNTIAVQGILPSLCNKQPTQGDIYMIVARDLLQGVEALSVKPQISTRSCSLISAHTLECILKAFLWHKGKKKEIRARNIQHNLVALWTMAYNEGCCGVSQQPPDWVSVLSVGHGPNFYFRYQEGEEKKPVHGGQTPLLIPMKDSLEKLLRIVDLAIKRLKTPNELG